MCESGVYRLILRSKAPVAIEFQDWLTEDVLPKLRASGGYIMPTATSKQLLALQNEVRSLSDARRDAEWRLDSVQKDYCEIKENVETYRNFILSLIDKNIRKSKGRVTYNKIFDVLQNSLSSAGLAIDFHTERRERILELWSAKTGLSKLTLTTTYETTGRDGGIPGFIRCASAYYANTGSCGDDFEQWKLTELFGY